jgi:hypothetical protein
MKHAYTEDQLVEQPAIGLFAEMGWQTVSAMEETFGAGGTLGRETKGEAVPVPTADGVGETERCVAGGGDHGGGG